MIGTFSALPGNNPVTYGPGNAPMLNETNPPTLLTNITVINNPKRKREQSMSWHKHVVKRFGSNF